MTKATMRPSGLKNLLTKPGYIVKITDVMVRPLISNLSLAHERILKAVGRLSESSGYSSIAELVENLKLSGSSSITATLKIMQRNGFIHVYGGGERGRRRTVCLTARGKARLGIGGLRVLGSIPAGPLSDVLEQCESLIETHELLPHKPGDFLLVVQGDSMIGDGILPNDRVLLRPHVPVRDREIAAVHVGDEFSATLKRVCFSRGRTKVTLKASNPNHRDIEISTQELKVIGVFRGLIRVI